MRKLVILALNVCFALLIVSAFDGPEVGTAQRNARIGRVWNKGQRLNKDSVVTLTVALSQRDPKALREFVSKVSDPNSASYGQYMTVEEISMLVGATDEALKAVTQFFYSMGAKVSIMLTKDFLRVEVPAGALEEKLQIRMFEFRHLHSGRLVYRTLDRPQFPADVRSHIDVITGLHDFHTYRSERIGAKTAVRSAVPFASTDPSPFIARVTGGPDRLDVEIVPFCKNGQTTADPNTLCSDFPPTISSIEVAFTPDNWPTQTSTSYNTPCVPGTNTVTNASMVTCHAIVHVPQYTRTNVSATTTFSDGTTATYNYPVRHAPAPYAFPQQLYETYNVPSGMYANNPQNSQSVIAFESELQYFSSEDLKQFFQLVGLPEVSPAIHGNNNDSLPGGEASLDIQYIMATGRGVPTTFWSVAGPFAQGGYILEWAMEISNTTAAPLVTSISYGDTEQGYYDFYGGWDYILRMETELAKMAARGLTVLAGSGDAGASNVGEAGNDLSPTDPTCTPLRAFYPSNSQYVVSVSSTFYGINAIPACYNRTLIDDPVVCDRIGEIAVGLAQGTYWTTGGGFSNLSTNPQLPWQSTVVQQFLQQSSERGLLPPSSIWNSAGRAYPDVAALGYQIPVCGERDKIAVIFGGQVWPIGGTSASGPIFAGLVSLLNEHRLNHGLPSVGHVGPLLYDMYSKHPQVFNDIIVGDNRHGDLQFRDSSFPSFCEYGFFALPGWDAVTGLGTPNWGEMQKHVNDFAKGKKQ